MSQGWRSVAPLLLLAALAAVPLFRDLGGPLLWEDEGDTAVFASTIVPPGSPPPGTAAPSSTATSAVAWFPIDGHDLVMVGTPWLSFYATAASFAGLGPSRAGPRACPSRSRRSRRSRCSTHLVQRATGCRRAALAASLLLLASTQFLLYARECRSYAFNMLFAVLAGFLRLRERRRDPRLVVATVLLFHTQIMPAAIASARARR